MRSSHQRRYWDTKMKFPNTSNGIGTLGLIGIVIVAGVIWGALNPWWLTLGIFLTLAGIGDEAKRS